MLDRMISIALLVPVTIMSCGGGGGTSKDAVDAPVDVLSPDLATDVPDAGDSQPDQPLDQPPDQPLDAPGCAGSAPLCAAACGSDWLPGHAECKVGGWVCPPPWVLPRDCPPNTCWGPPAPGEWCGPDGWECRPEKHDGIFAQCPDLMCPECTGFPGPVTVDGCHCECDGSYVKCKKVSPEPPVDSAEVAPDAQDSTDAPDAPKLVGDLVLDPASLMFFSLPINSIRFAVSGYDPKYKACATIMWDFSNLGKYYGAHCDDFEPGFPYVLVKPDTVGPCGEWSYGGGDAVTDSKGCVDFAMLSPSDLDLVDVLVTVKGDTFTGTIRADNRSAKEPPPVSLGLAYTTDIPEAVFVQTVGAQGTPEWVRIRKTVDSEPFLLFDPCGVNPCAGPIAACPPFKHQVLNITNTSYQGKVFQSWDGRFREVEGGCVKAEPAPPGEYVAEFCFSWQTEKGPLGEDVLKPSCFQKKFTFPTPVVTYAANMGG